MLRECLDNLNLPGILSFSCGGTVASKEQWRQRRQEIQDLLCREEYGFFPPSPVRLNAEIIKNEPFCAGKAILSVVKLTATLENGDFSFPVYCCIPKSPKPVPAILHINFRDCVPDRYMPSEEVCDHGFATVSFCYKDITSDDGDFTNGLSGFIYKNTVRTAHSPGKISMWAWAAMRVMDYMQTLDSIDKDGISVVGHSRLGKTALLTGAFDERFAVVMSNNSGCSGAALSRGKAGERIKDICRAFPYWFCEKYQEYAGNENALLFDQHFLLSLIAPRRVYVASAEEDIWADPRSEILCCVAASEVYELLELPGFITPDKFPAPGEHLHDGYIGYHIRHGSHYFSRYDWLQIIEYIKKHAIVE